MHEGPFVVEKWVRDQDLESALNKPGRAVVELFRNAPDSGGETTTIVFIRVVCEEPDTRA